MFQDCLESKDEREELKTVSGKVDIWIDKDIDVGFEDNMDCVESKDQTEKLETLPEKVDIEIAEDAAENMDHAESKAQTEELETLSSKIDTGIDKEINVGAAYLMVIGKGNQRSSEKEECNWKTNYQETNRECIAPSTEVGVLAGNMDVGTDKPDHVIGEYEHDKVVGEGNQDTFQIKEQYQKKDIDEDDLAEIWKEMAMQQNVPRILLLILQLMKHLVYVGKNVITFSS
ncbi:protein CHROMATIN REMODELING 35 isoform X4 [Prunus yedoensis var. nudiflora]|uniref:Protein CHROMATIN REMODELING 35 isoform X4 n=1 Tax=Prunus yedoensis var. nudiflora TaxID=2094558 RepID=A0A314UG66_PRUYE|nr:protein CHROMATIN REMODELING 35 isoform X4 [Prunus yedoensis var. nudiflora]